MLKNAEIKEIRPKETKLSRHNSLLINAYSEKKLSNLLKKTNFPPNPKNSKENHLAESLLHKSNSGDLMKSHLNCTNSSFKSLSPVYIETNNKKEKNNLSVSILNLKLSSDTNKNPKTINSIIEKRIIEKMEKIEKLNSLNKTKDYLSLFAELIENVPLFANVLHKFKIVFDQLFLQNLALADQLERLKEKNKKIESFKVAEKKNLKNIEEFKVVMSKKSCKAFKTKADTKIIEFESKNDQTLENSYKNKSFNKIPKLHLKNNPEFIGNTSELYGFHQEFMSNIDEFSESWRKLVEEGKKY